MNVTEKDKLFPHSKKIKMPVTASLGDLKAELLKRRENAAATASNRPVNISAKSTTIVQPKWKQMAEKADHRGKKKEKKESKPSSSRASKATEEDEHLQEELRRSREALERKTREYEARYNKAKTAVNYSSDEDDDNELIDFKGKVRIGDTSIQCRVESSTSNSEYDSEDEVEFTDALGRTRTCLKKDLRHFKELDSNIQRPETPREDHSPGASRSDTIGPMPIYEPEPEVESGPLRYASVKQNEVRDHGVGYFAFSQDEEERRKQMNTLNELRQETKKQRQIHKALKVKQRAERNEQLEKEAIEKGVPFVPPEDSSDEDEEAEPFVSTTDEKDNEILANKEDHARKWDLGKRDEAGRIVTATERTWDYSNFKKSTDESTSKTSDAQSASDSTKVMPGSDPSLRPQKRVTAAMSAKVFTEVRREEREEEFAPPSNYYFDNPRPAKRFMTKQSSVQPKKQATEEERGKIHPLFSQPPPPITKPPTSTDVSDILGEQLAFFRNS